LLANWKKAVACFRKRKEWNPEIVVCYGLTFLLTFRELLPKMPQYDAARFLHDQGLSARALHAHVVEGIGLSAIGY
jgi:hypothetical protein